MGKIDYPPKDENEEVGVMETPVAKTETKVEEVSVAQKLAADALQQQKKEQEELKKRALGNKIAFAFMSKEEKESFKKQESFANEYIEKGVVKTKAEKEFLTKHAPNIVRFVNSGKMKMPTDQEMATLMRDAAADKFEGVVSFKDEKIQYRKANDVNWAGSNTSSVA